MFTSYVVLGLACFLPLAPADDRPDAPPSPEVKAARAIQESLGVEFAVLESKIRRAIIPTKTPYGFKISGVKKDSPAANAGWEEGDILLEWNGEPIKKLTSLNEAVSKAEPREKAKFKIARYRTGVSLLSRQPWDYIEDEIVLK